MFANLCSWSHMSGISKTGKDYDFYVLHCSIPRDTIKTDKCCLTGFPVEFRDVSIPRSKWLKITNVSVPDIDDFLTDHIGESLELHYNISIYNGIDRAFISKVDFGGVFNA